VHAVGVVHVPFAVHVSVPLPEQPTWPCAHTPLQAPPTHVWLVQTAAFCQLPVALQVWGCVAVLHCVWPGPQTP
jgi:hypothetical protein